MNNQIIINSVNELGFNKTLIAIKQLLELGLVNFKQASQLANDLQQLREA